MAKRNVKNFDNNNGVKIYVFDLFLSVFVAFKVQLTSRSTPKNRVGVNFISIIFRNYLPHSLFMETRNLLFKTVLIRIPMSPGPFEF